MLLAPLGQLSSLSEEVVTVGVLPFVVQTELQCVPHTATSELGLH